MAEGHIVAGRQFRTKTDYEAALRDKKKIDKICSESEGSESGARAVWEAESGRLSF